MKTLDFEDMEMRIEFRTHCPKCGMDWNITSLNVSADPKSFSRVVASMRRSLEKAPKECCNKRLPVIGDKWAKVWP